MTFKTKKETMVKGGAAVGWDPFPPQTSGGVSCYLHASMPVLSHKPPEAPTNPKGSDTVYPSPVPTRILA